MHCPAEAAPSQGSKGRHSSLQDRPHRRGREGASGKSALSLTVHHVRNTGTPLRAHNPPECQQGQDETSEATSVWDFANRSAHVLISAMWFHQPDKEQHLAFHQAVAVPGFLRTTKGTGKTSGESPRGKHR